MPEPERKTMPALLACMMGLVLSNLVFVQLTEAASPAWLAPLYALTLAAPFLGRFKEMLAYRVVWNLAVVAFFGRLVQHALSADLAYVLQDGLLLAVLCQVHLLNNLRAEQRPDLLFLNSYLIAIITGYITVDLAFAAAFLAYAPFFVVGMQFRVVGRSDHEIESEDVKRIAIDGTMRSAVLLGLTMAAFFFWPRDFDREPLFAQYFDLTTKSESYEIDFSEQLQFQRRKGRAQQSQRVVLTAEWVSGDLAMVPALWRGATLPTHRRVGGWEGAQRGRSPRGCAEDPKWSERRRGLSMARQATEEGRGSARFRVVRKGGATRRLFLPREARVVDLDPVHEAGRLIASTDGTMKYTNPGELRFELELGPEARERIELPSWDDLEPFIELDESIHVQSAVRYAESLRTRMKADTTDIDVAREFARQLSRRYSYRLPGEDGGAASLHEFLTTDAGGHCELFASALTTMLRAVDVPARVVTGYRAAEWDPISRTLTIRASHAHAWVEVFSAEDGGWMAFDPTPAAGMVGGGPSVWERTRSELGELWARMTSFDADARAKAIAWLRASPARAWRAAVDHPLSSIGCGALVLALAACARRLRARRTPQIVRSLEAAFASAGVRREGNETPREALDRASTGDLEPADREALRAAVVAHESERYAA
ncbi:MAG: transglutaminase domain-containing protein [Planctomycetota bacterium]